MSRVAALGAAASASLVLSACGGGSTVPSTPLQNQSLTPQSIAVQSIADQSDVQGRPMFVALPHNGPITELAPAAGGLAQWSGSFKHGTKTYTFTMVGADPATSNATTTIPVDIIPLKIEVGSPVKTFDAEHKLSNGNTVIQNTTASPIFQAGIDYVQGGTDLGTTQYEDAFQRGNFWSSVKTNTNYHVLLGTPTVLAEQTIKTPNKTDGNTSTQFGVKVALVDINYYDTQVQAMITKLKIPAGTLPIFITYDTYLTNGSATGANCCIGGYHSDTGTNTYSNYTYVDKAGAFSQDVSALSHELGEWYDDPHVNNNVACGILEVGDPLENNPNFGDYPYTLNGFQYHLQDLVFLPYFGAPASTSVNNFFTFQGESLKFCQNGG